jgi:DNA-binding MarR family transcriptional regulator
MDPLRGLVTDDAALVVFKAIEIVRSLASEGNMPLQALQCFLYVCSHDKCHKAQMEQDLGLSTASGSRNTDYLCSQNRYKTAGLNLITKEVDPFNQRRLQLRLTPLGVRIKNELLNELNGLHNHSGNGIQEAPENK